jgi:cullin 1
MKVLTTGYWPTYKVQEINLPPVMKKCNQFFQEFYCVKTSHRRLQWVHMLGNATVKGCFGNKSYDFQVIPPPPPPYIIFYITLFRS